MKILFLISKLNLGGAERVLSTLANYLSENKEYKVIIATYNNEVDDFYSIDSNVIRLRYGSEIKENKFQKFLYRINRLKELRKLVKDQNPDVVIPLIWKMNLETIIGLAGTGKKIIACEHNNYYQIKSKLIRIWRLFVYRYAEEVVLLTQADASIYREYLKNIKVIPNPIFLDLKDESVIREKRILCAGRLSKVKQFDHAIYTFKEVLKQHPEWRLSIAGDGPELEYLIRYAMELGVRDKVDFLGNVKNMSKLYQSHSIYVLSSEYEGFPMVLGEAMLCGMSVISYNCPTGPEEMIDDYVSGILVQHNNKSQLKEKIVEVVENKKLRDSLGKNAKIGMNEFSVSKVGNKWVKLINEYKKI